MKSYYFYFLKKQISKQDVSETTKRDSINQKVKPLITAREGRS